jgi:hypothetical protein
MNTDGFDSVDRMRARGLLFLGCGQKLLKPAIANTAIARDSSTTLVSQM